MNKPTVLRIGLASAFVGPLLATPLLLTSALVPGTALAQSICETAVCGQPAGVVPSPYAEPQPALGGHTLAQYLAEHQAHRLWAGV
jgi:hypothetical protein